MTVGPTTTGVVGSATDWLGRDLGTRSVAYTERDAILYALAVGAGAQDLDLVFEDRLRVLPTFALTLAQWAPDRLAEGGAFEVGTALHGSQRLEVLQPLPRDGAIEMSARVAAVWDKGAAAVFDVVVESGYFRATWSLFAPGVGGFGGDRGPSRPVAPEGPPEHTTVLRTSPDQAVLYRLTGDRHHIHVDPEAARRIGQPRPILHGLATLASAARIAAPALGAHPAELTLLSGRFVAPVLPGDTLEVATWADGSMRVTGGHGVVVDGGRIAF